VAKTAATVAANDADSDVMAPTKLSRRRQRPSRSRRERANQAFVVDAAAPLMAA
jgi:hypothetical protein